MNKVEDFESTNRMHTHHVKQDSVGVESMGARLHDENTQ